MESKDTVVSSPLALVVRLFWFIGGNLILIFLLISIFGGRSSRAHDLAYWITVVSLVLARYVDIRHLNGQTAEGEPATMRDWRRYSVGLSAIALGAWLIAHFAM